MSLQELLEQTIDRHASDLHLSVGQPPVLRVDGELAPLDGAPLSEEDALAFLEELLPEAEAATWSDTPMASARLNYRGPRGARFRTVAYKHLGGSALAMRLIPSRVPAPEQLGMPSALVGRVGAARRGLVAVSGPSGSGKSTALYSLVDHINAARAEHIVCITEPTEFVLEPKQSMVHTIEIGTHMRSHAEAARAALRIDPDVVIIAEMRDLESIALALTLAETGHLVFTTLHCATAAEAVSRIVDVFPVAQQALISRQLAACVECVTAQRLIPRADGPGRVAAFEVMFANEAICGLIAQRRFGELGERIAEGTAEGMQTLDQHLGELVKAGTVREEDARRRV